VIEILLVGVCPVKQDCGCVRNVGGSLNDVLSQVQGEVIAFAFAGDEWGQKRLEQM